jgi:hypothetical protein
MGWHRWIEGNDGEVDQVEDTPGAELGVDVGREALDTDSEVVGAEGEGSMVADVPVTVDHEFRGGIFGREAEPVARKARLDLVGGHQLKDRGGLGVIWGVMGEEDVERLVAKELDVCFVDLFSGGPPVEARSTHLPVDAEGTTERRKPTAVPDPAMGTGDPAQRGAEGDEAVGVGVALELGDLGLVIMVASVGIKSDIVGSCRGGGSVEEALTGWAGPDTEITELDGGVDAEFRSQGKTGIQEGSITVSVTNEDDLGGGALGHESTVVEDGVWAVWLVRWVVGGLEQGDTV